MKSDRVFLTGLAVFVSPWAGSFVPVLPWMYAQGVDANSIHIGFVFAFFTTFGIYAVCVVAGLPLYALMYRFGYRGMMDCVAVGTALGGVLSLLPRPDWALSTGGLFYLMAAGGITALTAWTIRRPDLDDPEGAKVAIA